jgi:enamine deaminase RidA (YjgF/YER057c/UK114 family)
MGDVLDEAGKHARVAVSASSLPLGVAVEIDGIFQIA